jgi:D-alanyl-D-alanine carboxypeptidase
MDATRTTTSTENRPHRAGGYVWTSGQFKKSEDRVAVRPSGAFLSTVLDLARWDDAVRSRSLLKAASWDQILAAVHVNNSETFDCGFGFSGPLGKSTGGFTTTSGCRVFSQFLKISLNDHFTIIAMTNADEFDIDKVVHSIAGFYRPALEVTDASVSHETTDWNDYEFLFGTIDEPAHEALAQ